MFPLLCLPPAGFSSSFLFFASVVRWNFKLMIIEAGTLVSTSSSTGTPSTCKMALGTGPGAGVLHVETSEDQESCPCSMAISCSKVLPTSSFFFHLWHKG